MRLISAFVTTVSIRGSWHGLLRLLGVEAWFRRASITTRAGQQERVFLLMSLMLPKQCCAQMAASLESALQECLPLLRAEGGEVLRYKAHSLLLTWPAAPGNQEMRVINTYFQFCHCLRRLAPQMTFTLCGGASLGWVQVRQQVAGSSYRGEVIKQVPGILYESQRLGGGLLISAALRQHLPALSTLHHTLHVAFDLKGHRYPATLFRTSDTFPVAERKPD